MSDMPSNLHPDRMAVCFRTAGARDLPEGLTREPRFAGRLSDVLHRHYDLTKLDGESGSNEDQILAGLSLPQLDRLSIRAGIILRAREFLQEIRGPVLAELAERFGAGALTDARRHADLAWDRPKTADLDELKIAVGRDGETCLAAWIAGLPASLSRRVELKWPNDAALPTSGDAALAERGPAILRRLSSDLGHSS